MCVMLIRTLLRRVVCDNILSQRTFFASLTVVGQLQLKRHLFLEAEQTHRNISPIIRLCVNAIALFLRRLIKLPYLINSHWCQ